MSERRAERLKSLAILDDDELSIAKRSAIKRVQKFQGRTIEPFDEIKSRMSSQWGWKLKREVTVGLVPKFPRSVRSYRPQGVHRNRRRGRLDTGKLISHSKEQASAEPQQLQNAGHRGEAYLSQSPDPVANGRQIPKTTEVHNRCV
jgi:hypothetical protein